MAELDGEMQYELKRAIEDAERACAEYEENGHKDDLTLAQEKLAAEEKVRTIKARGDMRQLLKQPEFRRFAWWVMEQGPIYGSAFDKDSRIHAFNEGRRFAAQRLYERVIDADPAAYLQMQREHISDLKAEAESRRIEREKRERNR